MSQDLILSIKTHMNAFTKAEKKVAEYVLDNLHQAVNMSISDLSLECGTGETTVFRFCRTLKLKGYMEFRMLLALSVSGLDPEPKADWNSGNGDSRLSGLCEKTLNEHISVLKETYKLLEFDKLEQAASKMDGARAIYFYGLGASYLSAQEAHCKFLRITRNVNSIMDSHFQTMSAALAGEGDVAVIFTHSGSSKDAIMIMKLLKENGCFIICVTRFKKTPATELADIALFCGDNETPLQGGSASARISQLYIIDLLFNEYCRLNKDLTSKNRTATSMAVSDKLL